MYYSGFNLLKKLKIRLICDIEDAILLNKASLDRGFGRIMTLRRNETVMENIRMELWILDEDLLLNLIKI